jgi:catechol 2,3-dioxygenase-like lactoylglutathione lyase family enzyme/predicted ester cyclase
MRTLHVGLRVNDRARSVAYYTALGYQVVGEVPETPIGHLTMLKLPRDPFVSLELVHDPSRGEVEPGGFSHLVIAVDDVRATIGDLADDGIASEAPSSPDGSDTFWTAMLTDPDGYRVELVQWPPGHPEGMTASDLGGPDDAPEERSAKDVVAEMLRRQQAGDDTVLDDLVATEFVNHAAGPQGREGLRDILHTIDVDLGPVSLEQHHLVGEGDLVAQHLTLHGTHRASTMPLLSGTEASGEPVTWTFIHLWRVADGTIAEHWACRDDMGLLLQARKASANGPPTPGAS